MGRSKNTHFSSWDKPHYVPRGRGTPPAMDTRYNPETRRIEVPEPPKVVRPGWLDLEIENRELKKTNEALEKQLEKYQSWAYMAQAKLILIRMGVPASKTDEHLAHQAEIRGKTPAEYAKLLLAVHKNEKLRSKREHAKTPEKTHS